MSGPRWVMALALAALTQACAPVGAGGTDNRSLSTELLFSDGQCGGLERPAVVWIASLPDLRSWYGRIMSLRMNPPPPPAVDFPREGVLLIAMGQQPSAGYGLSLNGDAAVRDGVLTVRVDWREPSPGYRQAQVMSSPCLLAKMPDAPFARLQVLDQESRVRLEGSR